MYLSLFKGEASRKGHVCFRYNMSELFNEIGIPPSAVLFHNGNVFPSIALFLSVSNKNLNQYQDFPTVSDLSRLLAGAQLKNSRQWSYLWGLKGTLG